MPEKDLERFRKWELKFLKDFPEPAFYWREQSELRDRLGKSKYPLKWPSRL